MIHHENFKLILKGKEFMIPSEFNSFYDVDDKISSIIIKNSRYIVKSDVPADIFQIFIENWINMETPILNESNILDYEKLSLEFDRMKNIIEMYRRFNPKNHYLQNKNQKLKKDIIEKRYILNQNSIKYEQIITQTMKIFEFNSFSPYLNIKNELQIACQKSNLNLIDLYSQKVTVENGLLYIINEENKTALLFQNLSAVGDIFIPKSIEYETEKFNVTGMHSKSFSQNQKVVTVQFPLDSDLRFIDDCSFEFSSIESIIIPKHVKKIGERAFSNCYHLKKIDFAEPSELKTIEKQAFYNSFIESLYIPSSVEKLDDEWCFKTPSLNKITISSNNKNFILVDDSLIFGKKDPNCLLYTILCFAKRDIEKVSVPSFIESISSCAFVDCNKLQKIEFSNDSKLKFIGNKAFHYSSINNITIPSHVSQIEDDAFSICRKLTNINFDEKSELKIIGNSTFSATKIECISIPSNIEELRDDWCIGLGLLNKIIIFENEVKNVSFFNDSFLLGKSNKDSEIFDVLLFARRDIKIASIPSFVTKISPNSFFGCQNLERVEFTRDSELKFIGKQAFYSTSIQYISIPSHVIEIGESSFNYTNRIKRIEFSENSELLSLGSNIFMNSSLGEIVIPSSVIQIEKSCFYLSRQLKKIKFEENSKLLRIDEHAFSCCGFESISIPQNVLYIRKGAFINCIDLKIVEIQSKSMGCSIQTDLFARCTNVIILIPCQL